MTHSSRMRDLCIEHTINNNNKTDSFAHTLLTYKSWERRHAGRDEFIRSIGLHAQRLMRHSYSRTFHTVIPNKCKNRCSIVCFTVSIRSHSGPWPSKFINYLSFCMHDWNLPSWHRPMHFIRIYAKERNLVSKSGSRIQHFKYRKCLNGFPGPFNG